MEILGPWLDLPRLPGRYRWDQHGVSTNDMKDGSVHRDLGGWTRLGFLTALFLLGALFAEPRPSSMPPGLRDFLDRNCVSCHRTANAPAGLDLTALPYDLEDISTFSRWVRIHDQVRDGAMPPGGDIVLKPSDRSAFLRIVGEPMKAQEQHRAKVTGRSVMRRLNRYEYENTLRDLFSAPWLQLKNMLPEDGIAQRFNKAGEALDISHVQMARYMETADHALRLVLAASKEPEKKTRYYAREQKRFIGRMRYSPFNHHPERATIPILGFEVQPDVLAEKVPITVGAGDPKTRELEGFATPAGTYVGNEFHFDEFTAPAGGRYHLTFNAFSIWIHTIYGAGLRSDKVEWWRPDRARTSRGRAIEPVSIYALSRGGEKRLLGSFDVNADPALHEMDVYLLPGEQILPDASRLFRSRPGFTGSPDATAEGMPGVAYRWMEVTGPIANVAAQESVRQFFSGDDAGKSLRHFLARAYRRPAAQPEYDRYLQIINKMAGQDLIEALIAGYTAVLCSPGFLYLEEEPGPLNGYALASRLSYFLWNGPPDDTLRSLAANNTLWKPDVLRAQVNRLLDNPNSSNFINAFLDYWLDLRKLSETTPDQALYPEYYLDDLLLESALQETQLFVGHLIRQNLPARLLVASDFTMLNSRLARHYGLPPVEGVAMRQVSLPRDSVRGGLLTQASVLKVTANGTTTSPVLRGAWIMERILGEPPPPPPPGVPAVEPDTRGATTIRQQLEKHRSMATCAACHNKIDPAGFALENFDVLGGWRDRYRSTEQGEPVKGIGKNGFTFAFRLSQPVDASGRLPNGAEFGNVVDLKRLLLKDEHKIARNFVSQLITYATGTPIRFADREEVERMLDATAAEGYAMRSLIHQIVQSTLFTNK